jgi:hypothetical protein
VSSMGERAMAPIVQRQVGMLASGMTRPPSGKGADMRNISPSERAWLEWLMRRMETKRHDPLAALAVLTVTALITFQVLAGVLSFSGPIDVSSGLDGVAILAR